MVSSNKAIRNERIKNLEKEITTKPPSYSRYLAQEELNKLKKGE